MVEQEQRQGVGEQSTPGVGDSQTANSNISILANSNEPKKDEAQSSAPADSERPKWEGDARYFQTGEKAGMLRPRFRQIGGVDGPPRELNSTATSTAPASSASPFSGLNVEALKNTAAKRKEITEKITADDKKKLKEEKRKLSAEFSARVVVRVLDAMVNIISKGQYGENFNEEQLKKRLTFRETVKDEWREYLLTLDVDMAPWAMVAVSSLEYVGDAFNTPAGKERVTTLREKVLGGIFRATIGRFFK